jgi:hypothetical protein
LSFLVRKEPKQRELHGWSTPFGSLAIAGNRLPGTHGFASQPRGWFALVVEIRVAIGNTPMELSPRENSRQCSATCQIVDKEFDRFRFVT